MRMVALAAVLLFTSIARGQQTMSSEQSAKFEAQLRGWAETYYPAIAGAKQLPDDVLLGFLVDSRGAVLKHTAGFKAPVEASPQITVIDELNRLFPRAKLGQVSHGGVCFGGKRAGEPRYCVYFAEWEKGR